MSLLTSVAPSRPPDLSLVKVGIQFHPLCSCPPINASGKEHPVPEDSLCLADSARDRKAGGIWHLLKPLVVPYKILTGNGLRWPGSKKVTWAGFERQRHCQQREAISSFVFL